MVDAPKTIDIKAFEDKKKKIEECNKLSGNAKTECLKAAAKLTPSQKQILKPIIYFIGLAIIFGGAFFLVHRYLGNPKNQKKTAVYAGMTLRPRE